MAEKRGWVPKNQFKPGGHKGKLHRELGVPEGQKIPSGKLSRALHSTNAEVRNDAIRAKTMMGWSHDGSKARADNRYRRRA